MTSSGANGRAGSAGVAHIAAEDRLELLSVGVDIGSATTHLVFSRITLEKVGTRYVTSRRELVYQSPILLTPYDGPDTIDATRLSEFVDVQYAAAGIGRGDVESGALILTGVALLRSNARRIADVFAAEAGKMVAVSAGDNMEAVLAAHGSGAVARSAGAGAGEPLLHVDIGGGTTKLAVCVEGRVEHTLAVDVGARLVVTDEHGVVERLEEAGRRIGQTLGLDLELGTVLDPADLRRLAGHMARAVLAAAGIVPDGDAGLLRAAPLPALGPAAGRVLSFSGGVAEYIHARHEQRFGDLGAALAGELVREVAAAGVRIVDTGNSGIRATVVGASQYTVQLSGSTIHLSQADAVPLRNVQTIAPAFDFTALNELDVADALRKSIAQFDLAEQDGPLAIAFGWDGLATFERLGHFARGLRSGLEARDDRTSAIILVCYEDLGRLIGGHITRELGEQRPIVSVDCVEIGDFEFIDVGSVIPGSSVVPVLIKTLVFPPSQTVGA